MNKTMTIVFCAIFASAIFGYNSRVFSVALFDLFSTNGSAAEDLQRIRNFNPDREMFYLPEMDNKDFFESVNDLSICRRSEVRENLYIYLTSGREYVIRSIEQSYLYMPVIREIIRRNPDMPEDIALLPLLESGFNPAAVSKSNAVGLWQFLAGTSSGLGLKKDRFRDERRDVEKSTEAAIRHLRYLHGKFGSWDLALAAYNGGCGQVSRAMEKTGAGDFWSLRESGALSYETSQYVPRFAALVIIYRNRWLSGISGEIKIPQVPVYKRITVKDALSIDLLSSICRTSPDIIRRFNPELISGTIPLHEGKYSINIPEESVKYWNEYYAEL